jgi:hypothetical protein
MAEDAGKTSSKSYAQQRYAAYCAERAELNRFQLEISGRYDQWILTLSGGALGISLTFLEKIAPLPSANTIFLLGIAWVFLIASLLSGLLAVLASQYAVYGQVLVLDEDYAAWRKSIVEGDSASPPHPASARKNRYTVRTDLLNKSSAASFVLGVFFLCCFSFSNLPGSPHQAKSSLAANHIFVTVTNISTISTNR